MADLWKDILNDCDLVLSVDEKIKLDQYVKEYFVDFDYVNAAIRIGYPFDSAKDCAIELYSQPYVQREIARLSKLKNDDITVEERKVQIINGLIKEANNTQVDAKHSARVAAWSKLASIHGLDSPQKVEHGGQVSIDNNIDFANMTPEQLAAIRNLTEVSINPADDQ